MSLIEKIKQDLKEALKKGEKERLSALRMILSNAKNKEIEKKGSLDDQEVVRVIQGLVRQSKDALEQFKKGNREDLAAKEEKFVSICQAYLPKQLSEEELDSLIRDVIEEVGAISPKDMGKVMKDLSQKLGSRADDKLLSKLVKEKLAK